MAPYRYDASFDPPAPVVPVQIGTPLSSSAAVTISAFVDSGADTTAIPATVTRQLQMRRADVARLKGFDGVVRELPVFSIALALADGRQRVMRAVAWEESYVLLGRDLLNQLKVTLDGPQGLLGIEV